MWKANVSAPWELLRGYLCGLGDRTAFTNGTQIPQTSKEFNISAHIKVKAQILPEVLGKPQAG